MGNKQGKSDDDVRTAPAEGESGAATATRNRMPSSSAAVEPLNDSDDNEKENKQKIPRELFMKFLNCLRSLPFEISETEFQDLANSLVIVSHNSGEYILQKGKRGKGVFLVVEGHCEVITDENIVVRIIEDGNYFGEVSAFYVRPCSATVRAGNANTEMLLLPDEILDNIMKRPVSYPIYNWYVERRYLDLENTSMKDDIIKEMANLAIKDAPPFVHWSQEAIDAVLTAVVPDKVVFYPAGADIFFCDDEDCNAFLLIQGSVEIFSAKQESLEVFNSGPTGLWFGDEQLFCQTKRQITAKAYTPCILITISHECLQVITENFPLESAKIIDLIGCWKRIVENRDPNMDTKYAGQFCIEMSRLLLRKSRLFSLAHSGMLYYISLGMSYREVSKGNAILSDSEKGHSAFIVYFGMVMVESDSKIITKKLESCEIFFPSDNDPDDLFITAYMESVVGVFDLLTLKKAEEIYPGSVIDWKSVKLDEQTISQ